MLEGLSFSSVKSKDKPKNTENSEKGFIVVVLVGVMAILLLIVAPLVLWSEYERLYEQNYASDPMIEALSDPENPGANIVITGNKFAGLPKNWQHVARVIANPESYRNMTDLQNNTYCIPISDRFDWGKNIPSGGGCVRDKTSRPRRRGYWFSYVHDIRNKQRKRSPNLGKPIELNRFTFWDVLKTTASKLGLTAYELAPSILQESSYNPCAKNEQSTATGLYQQTASGCHDKVKSYLIEEFGINCKIGNNLYDLSIPEETPIFRRLGAGEQLIAFEAYLSGTRFFERRDRNYITLYLAIFLPYILDKPVIPERIGGNPEEVSKNLSYACQDGKSLCLSKILSTVNKKYLCEVKRACEKANIPLLTNLNDPDIKAFWDILGYRPSTLQCKY
ncbi:hypothetical protein D6810_02005 [Candidatus Dojkabacteria bacterium]|uniref:Transglycosylase SLT domain-containing protein n=1 Tax=Candidatus Dojkabacteria bacterium TaxID=2099670 RepID=A0A3M0Z4P2_9BACT|nr:MAG: hypothetical protein D6810_02005 [Candidatus Dojkabacteria bacterium]